MGIFGKMGEAFGFKSLEPGAGQKPPFKQAKDLLKELKKDPKSDIGEMAALERIVSIIERTQGNREQLIEEFKHTRDLAHIQPFAWLLLSEHVRKECGDKGVYQFPDFAIEGKGALQKAKETVGAKSDTEKKILENMEKIFEKKETFSSIAHPTQPANDNNPANLDKKAA